MSTRSGLSTHVLDLTRGQPAGGMTIELWIAGARVKTVVTNADGRTEVPLLEGEAFAAGEYELIFHVGDYFDRVGAIRVETDALDVRPAPPIASWIACRCASPSAIRRHAITCRCSARHGPTALIAGADGALRRARRRSATSRRLTRTFHSPAMQRANAQVGGWMREAGLEVREDAAFNLIGRWPAAQRGARTLLLGSHLDTVRDAGKYDGPLGVLVALAAVQHLKERLRAATPARSCRFISKSWLQR